MIDRLSRILILVPCLVLFCSALSAQETDGPLQVRNQLPLFLSIMPPYLEPAAPRNSVFAGLSHSSVSVVRRMQPWAVSMDLELTEFDLRVKKKIGSSTELGIEVPVIRPTGGFFDEPLDQWHDLLNVGDYGRSARQNNAFLYVITLNNSVFISGVNDRTGLGDVRLTAKQVIREGEPLVSLMAGIEVPTGDARTGYGNGSYDAHAAVLADHRFQEKYSATMSLGVTVPGDFRGYQTIGLRPFWHAGGSLEAAWWSRFSVIAQVLAQTSPLPRTGIRQIDAPGVLLTVGGRYYGTRGNVEIGLTEDLNTTGAPDFTATAGYSVGF